MTNKTMTEREFYEAVIAANLSDEMNGKARERLAALDARNEKRKNTESKEKREAAARRGLVLGFLQENTEDAPFTRDVIANATGLKPSEVTSACTALVKSGEAVRTEVKIDKAKRVVYSLA